MDRNLGLKMFLFGDFTFQIIVFFFFSIVSFVFLCSFKECQISSKIKSFISTSNNIVKIKNVQLTLKCITPLIINDSGVEFSRFSSPVG